MNYYTKKQKSIENISISKIEIGIKSIKKGIRSGEEIGTSLDYFFDKLKETNEAMYEDLYLKYCLARLEAEKKNCIV